MKRPFYEKTKKKTKEIYTKVSAIATDETWQRKTEAQAKRVERRFFTPRILVPLFIGVIVLLLLVSAVTIVKEHQQAAAQPSLSDASAISETEPTAAPAAISENILLAVADSDSRKLWMLAVLHADSADGTLSVAYVSPQTRVDVNDNDCSLQRHFTTGGANELLWAVGGCLQREIDRYLLVTDDDFVSAAKNLGDHVLTIDEDVNDDYNGIPFIIEKGEQTLSGDGLWKYFVHTCRSLYTGGDEKVTELLSYLAAQLLRGADPDAMQQHLTRMLRGMGTNISAMDLARYAAAAPAFVQGGEVLPLENDGVFRPAEEAEN